MGDSSKVWWFPSCRVRGADKAPHFFDTFVRKMSLSQSETPSKLPAPFYKGPIDLETALFLKLFKV